MSYKVFVCSADEEGAEKKKEKEGEEEDITCMGRKAFEADHNLRMQQKQRIERERTGIYLWNHRVRGEGRNDLAP